MKPVLAAVFAPWAPAASPRRRRAASAAATFTVSLRVTTCASPRRLCNALRPWPSDLPHLYQTKEGGAYQVKDPEKLKRIAKEWDIETEGKDIYDLAHEVAEVGLLEYGKPFGVQRYLKRARSTRRSCGTRPASSRAPSTARFRSRCI